ncbi:restriction endonuclease [Desulfofundulus salinus]|uniref:Restriction endonuclease n=2 Tax=Desulfofundulus salinus TaxID=2419843 RepID=A0A494WYR9_9FIRM|nr:restriction endonuclease [Desulfofundulus salinum]
MWEIIKVIWPLIVILFLFSQLENLLRALSKRRTRKTNLPPVRITSNKPMSKKTYNDDDFPWHNPKAALKVIDRMSGREFEEFLEKLFQKLGYQTLLTPEMKDHGADLVIIDQQGRKFAIQAKKLQNYGRVGVNVLGEVTRGQRWYGCHGSIVITNQYFTDQMIEEAKEINVALWNRTNLGNLIRRAHKIS